MYQGSVAVGKGQPNGTTAVDESAIHQQQTDGSLHSDDAANNNLCSAQELMDMKRQLVYLQVSGSPSHDNNIWMERWIN